MRLAVLAPTASTAFRSETDATVGGAERQLVSLADAMVGRGHQVDVIMDSDSEAPEESSGGARIWTRYRSRGLPILKVLHPKLSSLRTLLRDLGSDCLLQRGAADLTGIGRLASKWAGIPFVFAVASESDLSPGEELVPHPQDRILYRLGAAGADLRVVQTRSQQERARQLFGGPTIRIPSFPTNQAPIGSDSDHEDRILWGGHLRPVKRPEWLLALARALPHRRFVVFGGPAVGHDCYGEGIIDEFERQENIDYLGAVSPEQLPEIYSSCGLLLNTSLSEGFPNTFLEAWSHGLDIVASVDPDGQFADGVLGRHAVTLDGLKREIETAFSLDPDHRRELHAKARAHLASVHSIGSVAKRWDTAIAGIL